MICELCSKSFNRLDSFNRHRQTVHMKRQPKSTVSRNPEEMSDSGSNSESDSQSSDSQCLEFSFLEHIKELLTAAHNNHIEIRKDGLIDIIETYDPDESSCDEPPEKRSKGEYDSCSEQTESEGENDSEEPSSEDEPDDFILDQDQISFLLHMINLIINDGLQIDKNTLLHIATSLTYAGTDTDTPTTTTD